MKCILIGISSALILVGCNSKPKIEEPREFVNLPIRIAAQNIPADSQEKVLYNPAVKSYAIGRRKNGRYMTDQVAVYRIEQSPEWNLSPQPDMAMPKNEMMLKNEEKYAKPYVARMEQQVHEFRNTSKSLKKDIVKLKGISADSVKNKREIDELSTKYKVLEDSVISISKAMENMLEKFESYRSDIKEMKEEIRNINRPPAMSMMPTKEEKKNEGVDKEERRVLENMIKMEGGNFKYNPKVKKDDIVE